MSIVLDTAEISVSESRSPVSFERLGPELNPGFSRHLLLDGKRAFYLGTSCDTCDFVFERLDGANAKVSPSELSQRFREGIRSLDDGLLQDVRAALPIGNYRALLLACTPQLVRPGDAHDYFVHEALDLWGLDPFWNLPHDPRTEYYRASSRPLGKGRQLYEFVVPMMPGNWLAAETTSAYAARLNAGDRPTALALSVLDVRQPADWEGDPAINQHWCLAHYLLDGHHKTLAAARAGRTVGLLSFLATGEGISSADEVAQAIAAL